MKITNEVRGVLERGIEVNGDRVTITAQLDRKLYVKVNEVLEALGGKWKRQAKAHVFVGDASSLIEQALLHGEVTTDKDMGFFPTPKALAAEMAKWVIPNTTVYVNVLEPSAGEGALIDAVLARSAFASVTAIEADDQRRQGLAVWYANQPRVAVHPHPDFVEIANKSLSMAGGRRYAAIIANPPFCKVGEGDHIDHLNCMLDLLADDGRLACVMPASLIFRQDKRHVALGSRILGRPDALVAPLSAGTFKEAGTMVNTCLVKIGKAP